MKLQRCCSDFRGTGVLQLCNECFLGSQGFLKLHFSRAFLMCIQQLFPVEGSHITWRVILPTPLAIKKEPNHCLKERLKISCQEHCVLASKPEQVVSRWRLGYTIPPCVCVCLKMLAASCVCARVPLQKSRAIPCTIINKLTPVQTERRESAVASALGGTGHGSSSLPTLTSILSSPLELSSVIPGQ